MEYSHGWVDPINNGQIFFSARSCSQIGAFVTAG